MAQDQAGRVSNWTSMQAYLLAAVCLLVGIAMGYFFRGSESRASASNKVAETAAPGVPAGMRQQPVTPDQLKHMADKQAEPLLAELQSKPNDPVLLAKVGNIYYDTQNYREAIQYYDQSVKADPKNPDVRTDLGTSYFYIGNHDRAIQEFHAALQVDPKHAQTLFNLGMVQWQGKGDAKAAVESWERLLKSVPDYPDRAKVQELVERAKAHTNLPSKATN